MTLSLGFTNNLLGELAERWGTLPLASVEALSMYSGRTLPGPWDRLSAAHVQGLEAAAAEKPELRYHLAASLDWGETSLTAEDPAADLAQYRRIVDDHRGWVRDSPPFNLLLSFGNISGRGEEKKAIESLRALSAENLNRLLWQLHRDGRLHGFINDFSSFLWCWGNKRKLVDFLTRERLHSLTLPVRAVLVLAMQEGITGRVMEQGVVNVLTGTHGADLTRLKGILDRHSPQDFQKLVEHDIDSWFKRRRILKHVATEAAKVRPDIPLVVSDIDDTLLRNWKDPRYPGKAVYPGVVAFLGALGTYAQNDWERRGPTFASARPDERTGIIESWTVGSIRERTGLRHPTVLSSRLLTLIRAGIDDAKYENFASYRRLFPEFRTVLVGDNGQEDLSFSRRVLQNHAASALAAFIHNVDGGPVDPTRGFHVEEVAAAEGARRIFTFDTYIGAALAAYEASLINVFDLREITRQAMIDVEWGIEFESDAQRAAALALHQRDRAMVESKYGKAG